MSYDKLTKIINILAKVGVTDLSTKKAMHMTRAMKVMSINELENRGLKIAGILVQWDVE